MQKLIIALMVLAMFAVPVFAQEQQAEQAGEQAEQAAEQAGEAAESAGQAAGEQAEQTGEATAQQAEEAQEDVLGAEQDQQQDQQAQQAQQQPEGQVAEGVFRLAALQGTPLLDSNGEEVGSFEDAVLTDDGRISHIIAQLDQVQDLESGRYAVQADSLSYQNQQMTLDTQNASQFSQVQEGQKPQDAGQFAVLLSQISEYEVIDNQGESVGNVEDIVVNLQSGEIEYIGLSFGGILGIGDEMFAVPYNDVWYNLSDQTVRVDVSEQKLDQLEGFNQDSWPAQADEQWSQLAQGEQQQDTQAAQEDTLGAEEPQPEQPAESPEQQAEQDQPQTEEAEPQAEPAQ